MFFVVFLSQLLLVSEYLQKYHDPNNGRLTKDCNASEKCGTGFVIEIL